MFGFSISSRNGLKLSNLPLITSKFVIPISIPHHHHYHCTL